VGKRIGKELLKDFGGVAAIIETKEECSKGSLLVLEIRRETIYALRHPYDEAA
jgi:hypothetical protein